jgi:hypothetical protein
MPHLSRREYVVPGEPDAAEVARRLQRIDAELRRRHPEMGTKYNVVYQPGLDARGRWSANPRITKRS